MAEPVVLRSTVKSVSVYRAGAVVTRVAALPSGGWPDEIAIDSLPLALSDDSLRVSIQGAEGAALPRPTDVRVLLVVPPIGETLLPPSQKEIQDAEDALEELGAKLNRLQQEVALLDRVQFQLPPVVPNRPPRPSPATAWSGALDWTGRAKRARLDEKAALLELIRKADENLQRLRRREEEASASRDLGEEKVRKRVIIRLRDGGSVSAANVSIEYRVPGACWRPTYVVRMARDGRSALLSLRALVVQNTGEVWDRVKLSLSTADLLRTTELPELKSVRIGRKQADPIARAWRAAPTGAEMLFEGLDRTLENEPGDLPIAAAFGRVSDQRARMLAPRGGKGAPQREGKPAPPPSPKPMKSRPAEPPMAERSRAASAPSSTSPMLPPSAPVMAMPPPAPPSSISLDMKVGAAGGGMPMNRPGAAPMRKESSRKDASSADKADGSYPDAGPPMEESLAGLDRADDMPESESRRAPRATRPDPATMRYSDLVMAAWNDEGYERGKLRPMTTRDRLRGVSEEKADTVESLMVEAGERAEQARYADFPGETQRPEESSGSYDYRYDAEGLVDVPSDGRIHSVPLFGRRAPVATTLVVVPRESPQAVRVAALKNPLEAPLLQGPAEIYLEDEFLVMSPIRTVPAGAELKIGLGIEEALKVARNAHFDEEKAGLLGGSATLAHKVEIEVASRLAVPARVEIRERVPVKDDENRDVEITVAEAVPPWEDFDQADTSRIKGGKRWRFSLGAGEVKKISYTYTLKIDAKNEVVGGNRRE